MKFASLLLVLALAGTAPAAVVVVGNGSNEPLTFTLAADDAKPTAHTLEPGAARPFPCDRTAAIAIGGEKAFTLDAYTAYVFSNRNGKPELTGIQLEGQAPPAGALPTAATSAKTWTIPVTLLVDDSERRTRAAWEPVLKKRFARAAEILEAHTRVRFELVDVGTWDADPKAVEFPALAADFAKVVKVKPGSLAVGYTGRRFDVLPGEQPKAVPFAAPVAALQSHVLIREREPRTEAEKVEVLVQQLGRHLGAATVPDRASAMRPRLGDGQAVSAKFRIGFDPLNVLAMSLVADELRGGKVGRLADLSSATQTRLGRIYGTVRLALPDEPMPEIYLALLDRAGIKPPEGVVPATGATAVAPPAPAAGRTRNAKEEAVRTVILAVAASAEANAKLPNGAAAKRRGDDLTAEYVRVAAGAALGLEKDHRASAFLLALGLALDDSSVLRDNPLTATFCKAVEDDAERRHRLAVLGNPTVRKRRDLCQHFAVSAALAEMAGPELAESAGLLKEQLDMTKASGFSFADLAADFAGIAFAKLVKAKPETLAQLAKSFAVADYVPAVDGLRDGISAAKFKAEFVSTTNVTFKTAYDAVWKRVRDLPAYAAK
jgi:hypothetical protein